MRYIFLFCFTGLFVFLAFVFVKWLSGNVVFPVSVSYEICTYDKCYFANSYVVSSSVIYFSPTDFYGVSLGVSSSIKGVYSVINNPD